MLNIFGVYTTQLTFLPTLIIKGQAVFQQHVSENKAVIPPPKSNFMDPMKSMHEFPRGPSATG